MTKPEFFVHPSAVVDDGAHIGSGCRIWHFAHIMPGARVGPDVVLGQNGYVGSDVEVGEGCRIQNNVSLYDGVRLGKRVFVGPSAVFTNVKRPRAGFPRRDRFATTLVHDDATIGANATIVCGVRIGEAAMIAAGAVVTHDVPDFCLVGGAPARRMGWVCRCGEGLSFDDEGGDHSPRCGECDRRYRYDSSDDRLTQCP